MKLSSTKTVTSIIIFGILATSLLIIVSAKTENPWIGIYTNNLEASSRLTLCDGDSGAGSSNFYVFNADCTGSELENQTTLFNLDFDELTAGTYTQQNVRDAWGDETNVYKFLDPEDAVIIRDEKAYDGSSLRLRYKKDITGYKPANYRVPLNGSYEELYLSYRIRADDNFTGQRGGKLPGLCGGECNTGGKLPTGYNGWSARSMWRDSNARLVQYIYHPNQPNKYAEDFKYDNNPVITDGKWHQVEHHIVMNTVGKKDGKAEAWFDGIQVLNVSNLEYRKTDKFAIDTFYFSTFYGGSDQTWAPTSNQYIYFDDIVISENPISH